MQVKICGLTKAAEAMFINKYKPDYIGIVMFFPKSKRNMEPDGAAEIISYLADDIKKVAVTVSPTKEQIEIIEKLGFDYLQIHGQVEDELIVSSKLPVWRAFNVSNMDTFHHYKKLPNIAGYVFDAGEPGSGKTFDWNSLDEIERDDRLLILAGGLNPENVTLAIAAVHPDVADVSSGVEYKDRPGKDEESVRKFVQAVRTIG